MTREKIILLSSSALLAFGLLGGVATTALAQSINGTNMSEAQGFLATKGSLLAAISAAESKTGGRAMGASFDNGETPMYDVEIVMPDGTMQNAMVDPSDNSVKISADKMDSERNGTETNDGETGTDQGAEDSEGDGNN